MNVLDQLIAAEKEATVGPWHTISLSTQTQVRGPNDARVATRCYSADATLVALLRNHAADLLAVVRAALIAYDGFGEDDHRFYGSQKRLAAALAPLLTTEGSE